MKEAIVSIVGAVFNIAAIILNALHLGLEAAVLTEILPSVNIIVVAVLWFFGYQTKQQAPRL